MTRLISEWIDEMENTAGDWSHELKRVSGLDYREIACNVSGTSLEDMEKAAKSYKIAVVPITSGQGTIDSFSESVAAIVAAMGFDVSVTKASDVWGIWEANKLGADIIYMADDNKYIALNVKNGKLGDNDISTGKGFAELLIQMASHNGKTCNRYSVAVLGFGIIGKTMAAHLRAKGLKIAVYDKNPDKKTEVEDEGYAWINSAEELKQYSLIADGTSEGGWLKKGMIDEKSFYVAPGIPLSLSEDLEEIMSGRCIHDLLEIGTAVMLGYAIGKDEVDG